MTGVVPPVDATGDVAVTLVTTVPPTKGTHPVAVYPSNALRSVLYRTMPCTAATGRPAVPPIGSVVLAVPGSTGLLAKANVGLPVPFPAVTVIWLAVPVRVRLAMDVPLTMASIPVPEVLAMAADMPVNWNVGLLAMPSPLVTDKPRPLVESVRGAKVDNPVFTSTPLPVVFRLAKAPVRLMLRAA
jgi:hypothetical protein